MAQQTSEQLDKKLRQEGYTPSPDNPNKYEKLNDRGTIDRKWTDGDYHQDQNESTSTWHKSS